jgi:hypothetical protein
VDEAFGGGERDGLLDVEVEAVEGVSADERCEGGVVGFKLGLVSLWVDQTSEEGNWRWDWGAREDEEERFGVLQRCMPPFKLNALEIPNREFLALKT